MIRITAFVVACIVACTLAAPADAQLFANRRPDRPDVTLPDGPVRQVILESCTQCHGIDEYGYYAMTRERWDALIERMKTAKSGIVEGTVISDDDKEMLLDWLVANFGPDNEPFFREYVPQPLTEADYLSDAEAASRIEASCSECHQADVVLSARMDEEGWRTRLVNEIARGAPLLIQDADVLLEWLVRTHGSSD